MRWKVNKGTFPSSLVEISWPFHSADHRQHFKYFSIHLIHISVHFFRFLKEEFFKGDLRDEADFSWDAQKTKNAGCKYFP